jgi:hypothetical protein
MLEVLTIDGIAHEILADQDLLGMIDVDLIALGQLGLVSRDITWRHLEMARYMTVWMRRNRKRSQ